MSDVYQAHTPLLVAVDCIIFGFDEEKLKLLLINRDFEPMRNHWSLMGGFVCPNESTDEAAQRVLHTLTGLTNVPMEQLHTFGRVDRDTASRVISVTYDALINMNSHQVSLNQQHGAAWFDTDKIPPLIFDHQEIVERALSRLKHRAVTQPIGFALLPPKFTMRQLQALYEAILEVPLDKRNFQRRIHSMNLLVKLDEKDRKSSKRGAHYFRFDEARYQALLAQGLNFAIL